MKTKFFLMLLIGMITSVSPLQGGAQNPWNYQRTIRVTDSLVEVFEGDGMTILLETYVGAVKGTSIWANLEPTSPSETERTRFSVKNGQTFWIDMNEIQGLTSVTGIGGTDPATLHPDNLIEVWGAGMLTYYYTAEGKDYYVSADVNHFGVTQWDGADLPASTILVVEEGSDLSGTLSEEGFYLAESELIGVPEWPSNVVGFYDYRNGNYIPLIEYQKTAVIGELLDLSNSGGYGFSFVLFVTFSDGTSNGPQYCNSMQYFTLIDHRTVLIETISLSPPTATLIRGEQLQLTATVLPENATNPDLVWSSSDPEVAAVNQSGLVTALFPGLTTIRATAQDGSGVFGEAIIEVVAPSYTLTFSWGDGGILSALVDGEAITSPAMLEEGTVVDFTATPDVNYVLEAWWLNGEVVDTIYLNVQVEMLQNNEILVTFKLDVVGIEEIILSPSKAILIKGEQLQLTATVLPNNATNPDLLWTSSDPEVAIVDQTGLVTAFRPGKSLIRAIAIDGSGILSTPSLIVVKEISPFSSQRSQYIEIEDILGRKVPSKGYPSIRMIKKMIKDRGDGVDLIDWF